MLGRRRTSSAAPSRASRRSTHRRRPAGRTAATSARTTAVVLLERPGHRVVLAVGLERAGANPVGAVRCDRNGGCRRPTGRTAVRPLTTHSASAIPAPPPAAIPKALNPAPTKQLLQLRRLAEDEHAVGSEALRTVDQFVDTDSLRAPGHDRWPAPSSERSGPNRRRASLNWKSSGIPSVAHGIGFGS